MACILTIEDEANIRRLLAVNLEARGHTVLEAESVEEGLPVLRQEDVDLVLLDIRLRGRDGWTLVDDMQQDPDLRSVPVLVVTGEVERAYDQSDSRPSSVKGVIPKPVSLPVLFDAIQQAVQAPC